MTVTTLIFIVVMSIVCSIIAIYFYDRKLMREIAKYEKKMYKKKKGNGQKQKPYSQDIKILYTPKI